MTYDLDRTASIDAFRDDERCVLAIGK